MSLQITEGGPKLSAQDILDAEERMGTRVPASYKDFLLTHNGGRPSSSDFTMMEVPDGSSNEATIKRFLGLQQKERSLDLEYVVEMFRERVPSDFFPIARDPGGNLIGIMTAGADEGRVFFWDHEFEAEEGATTRDNLYPVADDFDAFLAKLRSS